MTHRLILLFTGFSAASLMGLGAFAQSSSLTPYEGRVSSDEKPAISLSERQSVQPDYVVELFTSQGCSSCPATNKFISKFAQDREDALVLSFGVTYWDYLGWEDTFGNPIFTERQKTYGKALGASIYTPQIILNGSAHSPRYTKSDITSMPLPRQRPKASISLEGEFLKITADVKADHDVSVIRYQPGLQKVAVKGGENNGRTLKVENVVTSVVTPNWTGQPLFVKANLESDESYAVIFHQADTAKVITAAMLK